MVANINRLLTKPPTKLRNIGNRSRIQRPQRVLIKSLNPLSESHLDAVQQQIVLTQKILIFNVIE